MVNSDGERTEPLGQLSTSRKKRRRRVGECRECGFCASVRYYLNLFDELITNLARSCFLEMDNKLIKQMFDK